MNKRFVFSIALLFAINGVIAEQIDTSVNAMQKQLEDLKKFNNSRFEQIKSAIAELKAEQTTAQPEKAEDHPCVKFDQGKLSYASRIIADITIAVAGGAKAESLEEKLGFGLMPLMHDIAHTHTKNLKGYFKWLASNWTTLSLTATIYILKKTVCKNWSDEQVLRYILAAIYAQWTAGIAVAELGLDQEFQI